MSRAWCKVGLQDVDAALRLVEQVSADTMRAYRTMLLLDADLDPDAIDLAVALQQEAVDTWIAGVRAEVCNGVAGFSERGAHR